MRSFAIPVILLALLFLFLSGCSMTSNSEFRLPLEGKTLVLTAVRHNVIHVRYESNKSPHPTRAWLVSEPLEPMAQFSVTEDDDLFELETDSLVLFVQKSDGRISMFDRNRHVLSEDLGVTIDDNIVVEKRLLPDERIYGFGESSGPILKNGRSFTMWNTDVLAEGAFAVEQDPLYQSFPIYLSVREGTVSGFFLNNSYRSHFDIGASTPGRLAMSIDGGALDYYLFYGPLMPDVVEQLTMVTGRASMPPLWALGYHQCRWSYMSADEVLGIAKELRARNIPADAIWMDIDYMEGFRVFTWNKMNFSNPHALNDSLESMGFRSVTIVDPGVYAGDETGYDVYDEGVEGDYFVTMPDGELFVGKVWPGPSVFPDFTSPATRDWWAGRIEEWVSSGLDGIWIDMNEPATWEPEGGFPLDSRWDGEGIETDHRETHNVYALLMARATKQGLRQAHPDKRPFVLTRAGAPGVQRYAATWNGDVPGTWDHYSVTPAMLMSMGLSGNAFVGSDLGGFTDGGDPELFLRWVQFGAWTPFFRNHADVHSHRGEPWAYGPIVEKYVKQVIEQRYSLLPLWYSLFHEHVQSGAPMMRPLVFDPAFTPDLKAGAVNDQFLVGSHVMVAPIFQSDAGVRPVYFPKGSWTELKTGKRYEGPGRTLVVAGLDWIPVFARENAIIPSWPVMQYVGEFVPDTLTLDLYPIKDAPAGHFSLYEDDGSSVKPDSRTCEFSLSRFGETILLQQGSIEQGSFEASQSFLRLRFHGIESTPQEVSEGRHTGALLPLPSTGGYPAGEREWTYDEDLDLLEVVLPHAVGQRAIQVRLAE
ncbi:glycoside hydrolase family 31 protein [bacterium]|nr:glycoside hydrolase family 31 protein [bacterium]